MPSVPRAGSELDHVLLPLETDAEGLLEVLDLLRSRLLHLLALLLHLLACVSFRPLGPAAGNDRAGRRLLEADVRQPLALGALEPPSRAESMKLEGSIPT